MSERTLRSAPQDIASEEGRLRHAAAARLLSRNGASSNGRGKKASPPGGRFIDRDESWLLFNRRVLEEAEDPTNPLLERVKFLAITASNLDEFIEIRVAGVLQRLEERLGLPQRADEGGLTQDERMEPPARVAAPVREATRPHAGTTGWRRSCAPRAFAL